MNAPILVTGGAGFTGSWVVRGLLAQGEPVRVFDLPSARWDNLPRNACVVVSGDIRDRPAVARAIQGCRAVVHLAGLPQLWIKPRGLFHQVNTQGTIHVLEEAVRAGCARIVHVSSATVWPLGSTASCRWRDVHGPYCQSKLRAEKIAIRLAQQGAPIVVVSPTAPIGPGDTSRTPPTQLLLDACVGHRDAFIDMRLNLIDVRDLADGMLRALAGGRPGERFYLGHTTVELRVLLQDLAARIGRPPPRWRIPYTAALLASLGMEWWAEAVSDTPPAACLAGVRLTRRALPSDPSADLLRLGVVPRPLVQTLADTVAWFRTEGLLP